MWLAKIFNYWRSTVPANPSISENTGQKDFDDSEDWEWIMSTSEELLYKHSQHQLQGTLEELSKLRDSSCRSRMRPRFLQYAVVALSSLSAEDLAETQVTMDSAKRSKVIADVVHVHEAQWGSTIRETFFSNNEVEWLKFEQRYTEEEYSKNLIGMMREVGHQASHGHDGTLNPRVLSDIMWSMWNSLRGSIRGSLQRELTQAESMKMGDMVSQIREPLIELWIKTLRISKSGHSREGILTRKWKQEEAERNRKLQNLRGKTDAKFEVVSLKDSIHQDRTLSVADLRKIIGGALIMYPGGV